MRRYHLKARFRSVGRRHRAASRIGRAFRKYRRKKKKTYRSTKNRTSNIRLGRPRGHQSLRDRVRRLEISSKKHFDYVLSRDTGVAIESYGQSGGTTNESFSQMLAIQPVHLDGTIPPQSGSARGSERNTREGVEIFCTKVRLRGRILGLRANTEAGIENCSHLIGALTTSSNDRSVAIKQACQSRVHIVVLQDSRPSTIDPISGTYEPNPLPNQPQNPLQGLYQLEALSTTNTLESEGLDASLRNYTNNRFKIVHKSTLQFDFNHPSKWFDITINVNRKLTYQPNDPTVPAPGNTDPVNYNLLFYVSSVPSETAHAGTPYFIMTDSTVVPPVNHNLLVMPNLQMLSSRTYFRET